MTPSRDEVIRMAREAGLMYIPQPNSPLVRIVEKATALAAERATEEANRRANASWKLMCEKMVAAEREACAQLCDVTPPYPFRPSIEAAHAIRARSAKP